MRCIGYTKNLKRCKNSAQLLFCHQHRFQLIVGLISLVITIGGIGGAFTDVFLPLYQSVKEYSGDVKEASIDSSEEKVDEVRSKNIGSKQGFNIDAERVLRDSASAIRKFSDANSVVLAGRHIAEGKTIAVKNSRSSSLESKYNTSEIRYMALNYEFEPATLLAPFVVAEYLDLNKAYSLSDSIPGYSSKINVNNGTDLVDVESAPLKPTVTDYLFGKSHLSGYFLMQQFDFEHFMKKLDSIGFLHSKPGTMDVFYRYALSQGYGISVSVQSILKAYTELDPKKEQSRWSRETREKIAKYVIKENYSTFKSVSENNQIIVFGLLTTRPKVTMEGYDQEKLLNVAVALYPARNPVYIVASVVDEPKTPEKEKVGNWAVYAIRRIVNAIEESEW